MDVNSVLQNTRQYFQGIPSSSPASGELAPGASVGYSSPPVSSTATSIAAPPSSGAATAGYGTAIVPYNGGRFGPVSSGPPPPPSTWSTQPQTSSHNAYQQHLAQGTNGPRFTQTVVSAPYHHFYERSHKPLPSTSNPSYVPPQHAYASPSITRLKEQGVNNQGMFNMDSISCQQNTNYAYGKKIKPKSTMAPSSANVYKQPTQLEDQRYYNHHPSPPTPHPMHSPSTATRVAVMPHHPALPSHQRPPEMPINQQSFSHQSVIEQRVGYQQQFSYHASSVVRTTATAEKLTPGAGSSNAIVPVNHQRAIVANNGTGNSGEPVDVRYYVNRRVEATALQASPAITKRDSPLDLSVKTIRQSADSTAHDDAEMAALYNHHHHHPHHQHHHHPMQQTTAVSGYALSQQRDHGAPSMRPAALPAGHLAQLPYAGSATSATAAVSLPNIRSHSSSPASAAAAAAAAFNVTHQRTLHYPTAPQIPSNALPAVYTPEMATPYWNGQMQDHHHDKAVAIAHPPLSEYRREKTTFSVTIEKEQQIHRTQVNAEVSSMRFSSSHQFYQHPNDMAAAKLKAASASPSQPYPNFASLTNVQTKPSLPAARSPTPNSSRKRKAIEQPPAAASHMKNPRISLEWRENIDKEIENRLNAYTTMKAREQQEKETSKVGPAASPSPRESYRDIVPSSVASPSPLSSRMPQATPSPQPPAVESVLRSNLEKDRDRNSPSATNSFPTNQYLEQKAQHKLPVLPVHPFPQWYAGQQRAPANSAMQTFKSPRSDQHPAYPNHHAVKFTKSNYETRDLKIIEKVELKQEQIPLPPFHAFSTMQNAPSPNATEFNNERVHKPSAENELPASDKFDVVEKVNADKKDVEDDGQSRAALMASALAHPRFRTKAELKQVTPVDKSKDKTNADTNTNVKLPEAQSKKSRSHIESVPKLFAGGKGFDSLHQVNHTRIPSGDFDPDGDLLSPESPSNLVIDLGKQFSPRKRLLSRSERNGINVHRSSSETTVFDFRSSDSEDESNVADVHSLNDMRKDRKTRTPPSGTVTPPTVIDQLNDDISDDSKWLEACDELIQQFANPGQKKRGRKKKPAIKSATTEDDPPAPSLLPPPPPAPPAVPPALSSSKMDTDSSSDSDDDKPLISSKIKKEVLFESDDDAPLIKPSTLGVDRIKKEQMEEDRDADYKVDKQESEDDDDEDADEDSEQSSDSDSSYEAVVKKPAVKDTKRKDNKLNGTVELRGQRSNVGTTRIRIQNSLEDSSAAESSDTDDSYKAPVKKTPVRKAKVVMKKKKLPKSKMITRKKGKNIDPKREKVRHMMLRRIETRKSRMDALKASKSSQKSRSDSTTSEEQHPIMTRKMTRQECQREKTRMEELRSKKPSSTKKLANEKVNKSKDKFSSDDKPKLKSDRSKDDKSTKAKDEKCKKDKAEDKSKSKPDEKSKTKKDANKGKLKDKSSDESSNQKITPTKQHEDKTPVKSSGKDAPVKHSNKTHATPGSAKKDVKSNQKCKKPVVKTEPKEQPVEDVTRRSLRSRNIVVNDEKNSPSKKPSPKKIDLAKSKSPIKSKNEERKKPPPAPPPPEIKPEKPPSWEEELFNYKCSLRMPVKLINIAKPQNWPKNNGGASSLPDLDRSESDSDLLNDCPKQSKTAPKKRNTDESKVSNTKEFKDSVKFLKEKFDKKIEEHKASNLTQLMIENKMKIIPKSSDGPELLPTPSLDSLKSKLNNKSDSPKKNNNRRSKDSAKIDNDEKEDIVEDSLIGYFRKETVDVFKEVFEKHQVANQFKTVILESRTRTQTKEMKHNATLKQVFGCDRPASAPPVSDSTVDVDVIRDKKVKNSTNGCLKGWHKSFAKFKLLMEEEKRRGDEKDGKEKDFEDTVDLVYRDAASVTAAVVAEDCKDNNETEIENVVKRKSRSFRRKCRSSGFDYIRKKKKQKKEEDDEIDDKERKKPVAPIRPTPESIEDIQNEIKSWVVNKGIGETVLHKAARLGYLDISSYCLEKMNCTPSPTDNAGYTPLHEACTRGHLKIAKMLLKYGADVSASAKGGIRPLHEAVEHGNVELVRLLLAYGADPLLSTYAGQTPLSLVKDEQDDLREFLMLYLADIQGSPSKPWPFFGYDNRDEETCCYDPITDCPPPSSPEHVTSLEFEISDITLPTLYRFKNDTDLWMLTSDLPVKIRDSVTKKNQHQNQQQQQQDPNAASTAASASHYVTKKITRAEFEENVECASFLDYKFSPKLSKSKTVNYTMVKYNDKLLAALNIQKLTMSFS